MHIALISDFETYGGAAISASRLAEALLRKGHQVTRLVYNTDKREHPWKTVNLCPNIRARAVRRILPSYLKRRAALAQIQSALNTLRPDIINAHNLHGANLYGWCPELIGVCGKIAPTAWTLHDMWSFTGGCTYADDSRPFLKGCDAACCCLRIPSGSVSGAWRRRKRLLDSNRALVAVAPSNWMAIEALAGLWKNHRVSVIPYGLPLDTYVTVERPLARAALGVDSSRPILMMAAHYLTERRKGAEIFLQALAKLRGAVTVLTLGNGRVHLAGGDIRLHDLGFVDHERTKVLAYNAADVFVHPAVADNLPNVALEAIACGTPIVGFPVGGMVDLIKPGQTGWLANDVSSMALAQALDLALNALKSGNDLRASCRAAAESCYGAKLQAERYSALFEEMRQARSGKVQKATD